MRRADAGGLQENLRKIPDTTLGKPGSLYLRPVLLTYECVGEVAIPTSKLYRTPVMAPKKLYPKRTILVASTLLLLIVYSYRRTAYGPKHPSWAGMTMGTTYSIKLAHSPLSHQALKEAQQEIQSLCEDIEGRMSTYISESEISVFNVNTNTNERLLVSKALYDVVSFALSFSKDSHGTFNPCLHPLIQLWGFGPEGRPTNFPPKSKEIHRALKQSTYTGLVAILPNQLKKQHPYVQINLGAIAKGYAVDQIRDLLFRYSVTNFYVEMGGDGFAAGSNQKRTRWRIGIETPNFRAPLGESFQQIVHLSDQAIATSGDYRNFNVISDKEYVSHILDPRTGYPTKHRLGSVSVISSSCMLSDAAATALSVMGAEEGLDWVESRPDLEAIFMVRTADGSIQEIRSSGLSEQSP